MVAPLSQDLRRRIVRAVESGSSIRQAAARYEVSPSAAVKLMRRVRETGSTAPARIGGIGGRSSRRMRSWCERWSRRRPTSRSPRCRTSSVGEGSWSGPCRPSTMPFAGWDPTCRATCRIGPLATEGSGPSGCACAGASSPHSRRAGSCGRRWRAAAARILRHVRRDPQGPRLVDEVLRVVPLIARVPSRMSQTPAAMSSAPSPVAAGQPRGRFGLQFARLSLGGCLARTGDDGDEQADVSEVLPSGCRSASASMAPRAIETSVFAYRKRSVCTGRTLPLLE